MEEVGIPVTLLFSIIGALITGLVIMLLIKINSNEKNCQEKIDTIEKRISNLEECEKKNYSFRHNFETVTKGMMNHFETKFENLEKLMANNFEIIIKTIQNKK